VGKKGAQTSVSPHFGWEVTVRKRTGRNPRESQKEEDWALQKGQQFVIGPKKKPKANQKGDGGGGIEVEKKKVTFKKLKARMGNTEGGKQLREKCRD